MTPKRNNVNKNRVDRVARVFTVKKVTAILFVLLSQIGHASAAKIGNGTPKQNAFRNKLAVALRNKGMNGFQKAFAMSTAAALVPGPDQDQMMALVCPPKYDMLGRVSEVVPYATCLQNIAEVAKVQTKLLAETQEFISASLLSQNDRVKKEVASQLAIKNVETAAKFNEAVRERVRAARIANQELTINLQDQLATAKRNREKANTKHIANLELAEAKAEAAVKSFKAAQKRDEELRGKMWGLAGGLVDIVATPGAIFTSFKSFMAVFMILVLVLAGFSGMSVVLFFVPGSSKSFRLLTSIFTKATVRDDEGLKKACEELKKEMTKMKEESENKIKQLTAELTARTANRNKLVVNVGELTSQRNKLNRELKNLREKVAPGSTNQNAVIANLTRQRNNLTKRLANAMPRNRNGAARSLSRAASANARNAANAALNVILNNINRSRNRNRN